MSPSADEVKAARHALGLTQTECSDLVGVTLRSWQYYEAGRTVMRARMWSLFCARVGHGTA